MTDRPARFTWARFNADGILLAILCVVAAVDIFRPDASDLANELGYVPMSFYLWTLCYLTAGALLMVAFFGRPVWRVPAEYAGRLVMLAGFTIETWRNGTGFGWTTPDALAGYLIGATLLVLTVARLTLLLSGEPVMVMLGGRKR